MDKLRLFVIGDGVTPTGFSTVMHNILGNLSEDEFDIHQLGINYRGDPHHYNWKIYPAQIVGGDYMGYNRISQFANMQFDGIFILNDPWVIGKYIKLIKKSFKEIPPIVVYFPVDSMDLDREWFKEFDVVHTIVVYTSFGYHEVKKVLPENKNIIVIPHGIDTKLFYKLYETDREELRRVFFKDRNDYIDSFIVLNANRNQPRKRIDLTIQGFSLFAKDKPESVKLYLHMGIKDVGIDILKECQRYGVDQRLTITSAEKAIQQVPIEHLNLIYNICDVGINTSFGEGWSLTNMEHAVTGAPQIVPDHSALTELYTDCGILVPIYMWLQNLDTMTMSGYVHPKDIADALNEIYENRTLYDELSKRSYEKFSSKEYSWKHIVESKWLPVFNKAFNK